MSNGGNQGVPVTSVGAYVLPEELAKQLAYRNTTDERLQRVCDSAAYLINDWIGREEPFVDPVPPTIREVALSLAVDLWKQPDATFGIMGMAETGPVRVARDLVARYDASLIPFYDTCNGWGIA